VQSRPSLPVGAYSVDCASSPEPLLNTDSVTLCCAVYPGASALQHVIQLARAKGIKTINVIRDR